MQGTFCSIMKDPDMYNSYLVGMVLISACKLATLDTISVPQLSICATAISGLFNLSTVNKTAFLVIKKAYSGVWMHQN